MIAKYSVLQAPSFRYFRDRDYKFSIDFVVFRLQIACVTRARVLNSDIFNRDGYKTGDKTHRPGGMKV